MAEIYQLNEYEANPVATESPEKQDKNALNWLTLAEAENIYGDSPYFSLIKKYFELKSNSEIDFPHLYLDGECLFPSLAFEQMLDMEAGCKAHIEGGTARAIIRDLRHAGINQSIGFTIACAGLDGRPFRIHDYIGFDEGI